LTFEAYVAGPLAEFVLHAGSQDRLWLAEQGDRLVGCIAIVGVSKTEAQLRWYLVGPSGRGRGMGKELLRQAVAFCKDCAYQSVFLWTVRALSAAARLYQAAGFQKVEERPGQRWGVDVVEEKYVLGLG